MVDSKLLPSSSPKESQPLEVAALGKLAYRARCDMAVDRVKTHGGMPEEILKSIREVVVASFDRGYLLITEVNNKLAAYTGSASNFKLIIEAIEPCGLPFRKLGIWDFSPEDSWNFFRVKIPVLALSDQLKSALLAKELEHVIQLIAHSPAELEVIGLDYEMLRELIPKLERVGLRLRENDERPFNYSRIQKLYQEILAKHNAKESSPGLSA